jgi:argonaute-like protein implicated in RNA metabolism and viral defense
MFAGYNIAIQCLTTKTAESIVNYQRRSYLEGICAGIFAKAGGIPWILHSPLVYERYAAIDVGRQMSEWWAMGIVYDRNGLYEILPGEMIVGEDLNVEALKRCTMRATGSVKPNSFIILRDGDASESELKAFKGLMEEFKMENSAIISVKKNVPHRLFRTFNGEVYKPISGDFMELDDQLIILCLAGVDRYQQGTPVPKVLETIQVTGKINQRDVARDIFYLSYLNWGSPSHGYSSPAPLRLAHVLASALSQGLKPFGPPF